MQIFDQALDFFFFFASPREPPPCYFFIWYVMLTYVIIKIKELLYSEGAQITNEGVSLCPGSAYCTYVPGVCSSE